jgi:hypothetical protein
MLPFMASNYNYVSNQEAAVSNTDAKSICQNIHMIIIGWIA